MRHSRLATLALLTAGLLASSASAQVVAELQAKFSMKLKITTSIGLDDIYHPDGSVTTRSRIVSLGFSQRDILESMIEDGEIPGPLRGWSIVARGTSGGADEFDYRLYAVKAGQADYPLDTEEDETLGLDIGTTVLGYRVRTLGDAVLSGSGTILANFQGVLNADDAVLNLAGIGTIPFTYKPVSVGETTTRVLVPGQVTLRVMGGATISDPDFGELPVVIEGSMGFSPHVVTGVSAP